MTRLPKHRDVGNTPAKVQTDSMADLAGTMADDFNNILTTVMGACSLIDREVPDHPELRQCVEIIRNSAERAALLSGKLQQVSSGRVEGDVADHSLPRTGASAGKSSRRDKN